MLNSGMLLDLYPDPTTRKLRKGLDKRAKASCSKGMCAGQSGSGQSGSEYETIMLTQMIKMKEYVSLCHLHDPR